MSTVSLFDEDPLKDADKPRVTPGPHEPTEVSWKEALTGKKAPPDASPKRVEPKQPGPIARWAEKAEREEQARRDAQARIICQFCHQAGDVTAKLVQKKQGVSGGKATAAILTGGVSLVAVGLSRKGMVTRLSCANCGMTWDVE